MSAAIFEVFTNPKFLELEAFAPLVTLQHGESAQHTEDWRLFDGIPSDDIRSAILPCIGKIGGH